MAFRGSIQPERWNKILKHLDDLSRRAVKKVFCEDLVDYEFTFRTNGEIVPEPLSHVCFWQGCQKKTSYLCVKNFSQRKFFAVGILIDREDTPQRKIMVFKNKEIFDTNQMVVERNLYFLLKWCWIIPSNDTIWLCDYLRTKEYEIPISMEEVELDKIQIFSPMVIKNSWQKSLRKDTKGKTTGGFKSVEKDEEESDKQLSILKCK